MNFQSKLGLLRILAVVEGVSYLLFGITMPLKYVWGITAPNYIVGMAHGWLFISYIILCLLCIFQFRWKLIPSGLALAASLVPFGTFVADAKLFKPAQLKALEAIRA